MNTHTNSPARRNEGRRALMLILQQKHRRGQNEEATVEEVFDLLRLIDQKAFYTGKTTSEVLDELEAEAFCPVFARKR